MSLSDPQELVLDKVMSSVKTLDVEMGKHILDILGIDYKAKRKNFFKTDHILKWRHSRTTADIERYRHELRQMTYQKKGQTMPLMIFAKDIEYVLRLFLGPFRYVFPEELCIEVDNWHRTNEMADFLQCNAKCTRCEIPCKTADDYQMKRFLARLEPKKEEKTPHPKTFQKILMHDLKINAFEAMSILDAMGLKYDVSWAQMRQPAFSAYWLEYVWTRADGEKKMSRMKDWLGITKTAKLQKLITKNFSRYEKAQIVPDEVIINNFN